MGTIKNEPIPTVHEIIEDFLKYKQRKFFDGTLFNYAIKPKNDGNYLIIAIPSSEIEKYKADSQKLQGIRILFQESNDKENPFPKNNNPTIETIIGSHRLNPQDMPVEITMYNQPKMQFQREVFSLLEGYNLLLPIQKNE